MAGTGFFEVGKRYRFRTVDGDGQTTFWGVVEAYEHPLLKIADGQPTQIQIVNAETKEVSQTIEIAPQKGRILNVTSPSFVDAAEDEDKLQVSEEDANL